MIKLPNDVEYIIDTLEKAGFEGYAVGGCVRDSLLGKTPGDWDIATSAAPEQVMAAFKGRRVLPTGIKHGTVTLLLRGAHYEITAYRVDGSYSDGRRPDQVTFTTSLREDLSRRDFTVNAMAYNNKSGLADPFRGAEDLERRLIRCVGDPRERFGEDYLRMMRAYRFSATLDFDLDPGIADAVRESRGRIHGISAERIRMELDKILLSGNHLRVLAFMEAFGAELFPEVWCLRDVEQINKYHYLNVYDHTMEVQRNAGPSLVMKLTALLHDTGKAHTQVYAPSEEGEVTHFKGHAEKSAEIALDVLKRLKYDNETINRTTTLIREHGINAGMDARDIKRLINRIGVPMAKELLAFAKADVMGKTAYAQEEKLPALEKLAGILDEVVASREAWGIGDLALSGQDVKEALGISAGKAVGDALRFLLERVIEEPGLNTREGLLAELRKEYAGVEK